MRDLPQGTQCVAPRLWPLIALAGASSRVIVSCASFAPAVLQRRATQALINLIAVVGLYVFVGNSGVLSFGNVAFMAVGAYVSALLTMKPAAKAVFLPDLPAFIAAAEWPTLPGALAGGGAAALAGLRRRLAADAPVGHLGEHRDLRRCSSSPMSCSATGRRSPAARTR